MTLSDGLNQYNFQRPAAAGSIPPTRTTMEMKKKKKSPKEPNSIRLAGQRPITSTLLFRSSNRSSANGYGDDEGSQVTRSSGSGVKMSLSDFLSRKLHKHNVPVPPGTTTSTKDKEKTLSLVSRAKISGLVTAQDGDNKGNGEEQKCVLDKAIFDKFKPVVKDVDEECINTCIAEDVASWTGEYDVAQESGKRRGIFDDMHFTPQSASENTAAKRHLVVLGDDPKPGSGIKRRTYSRREEGKPHYNHYANGRGWWDSSMEGIDNDEVGFSEIWEGVGSTTLGGLDWH